MNAADDYQFETSRKDLAAGILKQAALDLRRFHGATRGVEREFYLDAYRWVMSDDSSWSFSFLNVCQALNLEPETVRARRLQTLRRAGSESGSVANIVRKFHFAHPSHRQLSERHARAVAPRCRRQGSRRAELTCRSKLRPISRIESRNRLQRICRPSALHAPSRNQGRGLRPWLGALPL